MTDKVGILFNFPWRICTVTDLLKRYFSRLAQHKWRILAMKMLWAPVTEVEYIGSKNNSSIILSAMKSILRVLAGQKRKGKDVYFKRYLRFRNMDLLESDLFIRQGIPFPLGVSYLLPFTTVYRAIYINLM